MLQNCGRHNSWNLSLEKATQAHLWVNILLHNPSQIITCALTELHHTKWPPKTLPVWTTSLPRSVATNANTKPSSLPQLITFLDNIVEWTFGEIPSYTPWRRCDYTRGHGWGGWRPYSFVSYGRLLCSSLACYESSTVAMKRPPVVPNTSRVYKPYLTTNAP